MLVFVGLGIVLSIGEEKLKINILFLFRGEF